MSRVLLVIGLLALAGCGGIAGYEIDRATTLCESHGGIRTMWRDLFSTHLQCNDGIRIMGINRQGQQQ